MVLLGLFYKENHDSNSHSPLVVSLVTIKLSRIFFFNEVICYGFSNINKGDPLTINVTSSIFKKKTMYLFFLYKITCFFVC